MPTRPSALHSAVAPSLQSTVSRDTLRRSGLRCRLHRRAGHGVALVGCLSGVERIRESGADNKNEGNDDEYRGVLAETIRNNLDVATTDGPTPLVVRVDTVQDKQQADEPCERDDGESQRTFLAFVERDEDEGANGADLHPGTEPLEECPFRGHVAAKRELRQYQRQQHSRAAWIENVHLQQIYHRLLRFLPPLLLRIDAFVRRRHRTIPVLARAEQASLHKRRLLADLRRVERGRGRLFIRPVHAANGKFAEVPRRPVRGPAMCGIALWIRR